MMDTSEIYIKMCDCWDIQLHRIPTIKSIGDEEECRWEDGDFFAQNILINSPPGAYVYKESCPYCAPSPGIKMIWLPRQDQIQGMIEIKDAALLFHRFHKFCYRDSITNLIEGGSPLVFQFPISISWEQLWLAFYMHEKHGKIWDKEKWVKNNE